MNGGGRRTRRDRGRVAAVPGRGATQDAVHNVPEVDMGADGDQITPGESEALEAESRQARLLDEQLADDLHGDRLAGATSSAGYLRALGDRPRPPRDLEDRLVEAARSGDRRAREELVESFLPLIARVARVYRGSPAITRVELMQEGVVGLLRALERFDPEEGVPFWGYAVWWVRQAMQQLIAELTLPTVLSDRALRHLALLKRAHSEFVRVRGHEPTGQELTAATGLSRTQVDGLLALERAPWSMEAPIRGDDGEVGAFGELLADPLASDAYEQLLNHSEIEQVRALLGSLNERERTILRARYGLDGPERSLRELGEQIGLSAERVRQIEERALGKLRAASDRPGGSEVTDDR